MPIRVVLGPQRPDINLGEAFRNGPIPDGPVAVVSSGWQEAEGDIDDIRDATGRQAEDLLLYQRAQTIFDEHAELASAYRERQDRLVELQRLHRLRLKQIKIAARQILRTDGEAGMLAPERRHAIAQLRALDRHHLRRIELINGAFERDFGAAAFAPLGAQRREIAAIMQRCAAVLITGGNVAVLMNRLRLFDLGPLLAGQHLVAWSAGAMALTRRVVLYHDHVPLARRDAELFGPGLGLLPGFVFLADAERRLKQRDPVRVGLLARRYAPDLTVALDNGTSLQFDGTRLVAAAAARRLTRQGRLSRLRAP